MRQVNWTLAALSRYCSCPALPCPALPCCDFLYADLPMPFDVTQLGPLLRTVSQQMALIILAACTLHLCVYFLLWLGFDVICALSPPVLMNSRGG